MSKKSILILGAKSDIGLAIAHRFAKEGFSIQLAGREIVKLKRDVQDIKLKYTNTKITCHEFNILNFELYDTFIRDLPNLPSIVVCVVGYMGRQSDNEKDIQLATKVIRTNFEGPLNILLKFANYFEKRGSGMLIGVSSVAGERGRAKNYIYGSSKSGFTSFLSGLRNQMTKKGIHIITVIPGYVATKMTRSMKLPKLLTAKPKEVADAIFNAVEKKRDIIYIKSIWYFIMLFIRNIPETIVKRLKL